jgi:hypothetical protein
VTYLAERRRGENFGQFCARLTDDELRAMLAGAQNGRGGERPFARSTSTWRGGLIWLGGLRGWGICEGIGGA